MPEIDTELAAGRAVTNLGSSRLIETSTKDEAAAGVDRWQGPTGHPFGPSGLTALVAPAHFLRDSKRVLSQEVWIMSDVGSQPRQPTGTEIRRLRRSRQDRVIGGVCGGLGRYLQVDPVLLRIAAVALALSGGLGVLAYVIAWVVIPEESGAEPQPLERGDNRHGLALVVGAVLVALGALLLFQQLVPWFSAAFFWPVVVVAVGVLVLASARR